MDKSEVAALLEEMALLLELTDENPFKVRAYAGAARALETLAGDLEKLVAEKKLTDVKGIGPNLAAHIAEILATGKLADHEKLKGLVPPGVMEMLRVPGLGPKRVSFLWKKMGIMSPGELEMACRRHLLKEQPGFGEKMEEKILAGVESVKRFAGKRLYAEGAAASRILMERVRGWPEVIAAEICGSIRRRREIIADIDILVATDEPAKIMERFVTIPGLARVVEHGETKSEILLGSGIQCDLRAVTKEQYPFALHHFTGSKEHNVAMRSLAKKAGMKLSEYGLFKEGSEESVCCNSEEDIFRAIGLTYIEPELRENMGEIEAAGAGTLPKLLKLRDLRGILHMHSTYTDGRASVEEMARAAMKLGFSWIAITDHSQAVTVAGGMKPDDIERQMDEIDELNSRLDNFRVMKGVEVDIMSDGSLDFDGSLLSRLDIVIAAIHSRFQMSEKEMTGRIIRALSDPDVDVLAHPTGRLLLAREPYAVNMNAVIEAAAKYGKAIEINAHPQRLDLDWRWCRAAKEAGVKIAISPDAHSAESLSDVAYGVGIARKGWLEKGDVINCLSAEELGSLLSR